MVTATPTIQPIADRHWRAGRPRKTRRWARTEWHDRILRERYDSQTATISELQRMFRVPRWMVLQWASQLGLSRLKDRPWSPEQEAYLESNLHHAAVRTIAKRLGRSPCAVTLKAKRLGLNKSGEGYTLRQVCEGLGEDHHRITAWVAAGALKGSRRHTDRKPVQGGDMWLFTDDNLRTFIRRHPMEINLRRVDQLWFMGVVVGVSSRNGEGAPPGGSNTGE